MNLRAYSGYFRDNAKLLASSSGGGATALSEAVIRQGGLVFGACYSPDFRTAEFACAENIADLDKLKGSKYIPTEKRIFHDGEYKPLWPFVAEKLQSGRLVLFTGLGCDVAALKSYIASKGIIADNLFTADLICYGPVIREVHAQFIDFLERKYKSRITSFTARRKIQGWTPSYIFAEFESGQKFCERLYGTDYGAAFKAYSRECCYQCKFKGAGHVSDITLGDFWGLTPEMDGYNPGGVSVFLVHNENGERLMRMIDAQEFHISPADPEFVIAHNSKYHTCMKKPADYASFLDDLKTIGLHAAMVKRSGGILRYYARKYIPRRISRLLKAILK